MIVELCLLGCCMVFGWQVVVGQVKLVYWDGIGDFDGGEVDWFVFGGGEFEYLVMFGDKGCVDGIGVQCVGCIQYYLQI